MSASSTPTLCPAAASAAARFTVTDDLPTPPLPLATAKTRVRDDGSANGTTRSVRPPRSLPCSSRRCSSLITSRRTATPDTPGKADTAAVTSLVMVSRSGQAATVRYTSTRTSPSGPTSTLFTMPRSVMGRRISGSSTLARAAVTCSAVGGETTEGADIRPCYARGPAAPGRPCTLDEPGPGQPQEDSGASRKTTAEAGSSSALSRAAANGPMTASHSGDPGSTRWTPAVQVTSAPPVSLLGTVTVTRAAPATPGNGCSPGPVTTYAAPGGSRQMCQAGTGLSRPGAASQITPERLVASAIRAGAGAG